MDTLKPTIIKRGYITYYIYPNKILVSVKDTQWISYNPYENTNRQGLTEMKKKIEKSKDNEYGTVVEQMSLAVQCGVKGTSTRKLEL